MTPTLIQWLHQLPNLGIWSVLAAVNLTGFLLGPLLVRKAAKLELDPDIVKGADDAFKTLVGLTMALIAFALVQVESLHRNVDDLVNREASIQLKLDRMLADLPQASASAPRQSLRSYMSSVVTSEWPAMANGKRSERTDLELSALDASVKRIAGSVNSGQSTVTTAAVADIATQLTQVKDVREARLASSHMSLSPYFWWGIVIAMLALAVLAWFQAPARKAIPYVGGIAIGLSTILAVLVVSSGIFEGESRVSPSAISRTLALTEHPNRATH